MREEDFSGRRVVRALSRASPPSVSPDAPFAAAVTCLAEMNSDSLTWLWGDVLAQGHVTLLTGASGVGKSFVAMQMVAAVTRGERDSRAQTQGEPAHALLISPEAELGDVARPRLQAAGAEMSRVHALRGIRRSPTQGDEIGCRAFQLDEDLRLLEHEIAEREAAGTQLRLIVIDPFPVELFAYRYGTADLVRTMRDLAEIAACSHVAILVVADNSTSISGSWQNLDRALHATAQAVWTVITEFQQSEPRVFFPYPPGFEGPCDVEPERDSDRLLLSVKANLKRKTTGLSFRLDDGRVVWNAKPVDMTAEQYHSNQYDRSRSAALLMELEWSELARAIHWLKRQLLPGVRPLREIKLAAQEQDISFSTLRRAFCGLKGVARRIGTSRLWGWALPEHDTQSARLPAWLKVKEDGAAPAEAARELIGTRGEPPQAVRNELPLQDNDTNGMTVGRAVPQELTNKNGEQDPDACAMPMHDELDEVIELPDGSWVSKPYLERLKQEAAEEVAALAAGETRLPFS